MRKLSTLPVILLGTLIVFQSCSKSSPIEAIAPVNPDIVNVTVALNGSYNMPVNDLGSVSISKQASHFQVSQTEVDSKSGALVYKYIPAVDYSGTDEVILSNTKTGIVTTAAINGCPNNPASNSAGATTSTTTSYTVVKINVTN